MINIAIDSGFWMALYTKSDQYHEIALATFEKIKIHNLFLPWPSMYETLNTSFIDNRAGLTKFKILLKQANVVKIEDIKYRQNAWDYTFSQTDYSKNKRLPSLVDHIIREMMKDETLRIKYLVTYNPGDFIEIGHRQKIEILYYTPDIII
jgi:predicted nucleic acid-binding protein